MAFGLTITGFNPKRLEDVRQAIIDELKAKLGQNIRTDDKSVLGQAIGVFAEMFADLWETAEDVYASGFLGSATGAALDDKVALAGIVRLGATLSVVTLTLGGVATTFVPAGSIARDSVTGTRWVTLADATIGGGGSVTVLASPETTGAVIGLSGTITEIVTPVTDWNSVTNVEDADVGRDQETDASLRQRFILGFRIGGGSSDEAIRAVLLNIDDVTEVNVVSNRSDVVDADGRPPHSVEAIVRGGLDQEIFDALLLAAPAGIRTFGVNAIGTSLDSKGDAQPVEFTRPIDTNIWVEVEYEVTGTPPADIEDLAEAEILVFGGAFQTGQDVIPFKFIQNIETTGFLSMVFKVSLAPSPVLDDPIVMSARQLADFDSSRITFDRTN